MILIVLKDVIDFGKMVLYLVVTLESRVLLIITNFLSFLEIYAWLPMSEPY